MKEQIEPNSYSSIMRKLNKEYPKELQIEFMKVFKEAFDEACQNQSELAEPIEQIALMQALKTIGINL